jgi:hypothetical protein
MGFEAIEDVRDFLTLVRSKSGYVDQGLHAFGSTESYHRTRIGVPRQDNRPFCPIEAAVERCNVIDKRR